jgi:hypothetical protein
MFAPLQSLSLWGVEYTSSAGLVGRRGAALYAGIAVMFFLAWHAEPSLVRSALVKEVVVSCVILAALGLFELFAGLAQPGILLAVFVEVAISVAFLFVDRESPTHGQALSSDGNVAFTAKRCTLEVTRCRWSLQIQTQKK